VYRVKVFEQRRACDPSAEFFGQGDHVSGFSACVASEQFLESSGAEDHQHADWSVFGKIAPGMGYASTDTGGRTGSDFLSSVSIRDERCTVQNNEVLIRIVVNMHGHTVSRVRDNL
jgi:hypothetical protein